MGLGSENLVIIPTTIRFTLPYPGYYMLLAVSVSTFVKDKNIYNYNDNVIKNCFCLLL
jgi:hypothetical protein